MRRELLGVILAGVLGPLAVANGAEQVAAPDEATRAGVVREMLDQSRLLEDAKFTIPLDYWEEYLREQAESHGEAQPAPVALVAEAGVYELSAPAGKPPVLRATVRLHIFRAKACANTAVLWARAPGGWEAVAVNGQTTALPEVDGWLRFSPAEPGDYVVTAASSLKDCRAVTLAIPRTVQTVLEFESPGTLELAVAGDPRRIRGAVGEGTRGALALSPREKLEFTVSPRGPETEHAPTFEVRGDVAWNFDPAGQTVSAALELAIVGGKTEVVDLALPAGASRVAVTGPDVREARPGEGEGGAVRVFLRGVVAERTRLEVAFQLPAANSGMQTVGGIAVRRGHWSGGTVVVTSTGGGSEAVQDSATGLAEIALGDMPASAAARLAGPAALAYQVTGREWSAGVELLNLGEFALRESIADAAHYEVVLRDDGSMMCQARYEIRNRTRQFLRVELPAGATVVLARVNEQSRPLAAVAGERDAYLLPLVRSKASLKGLVSFPVEIVALYRVKPLGPEGEAALPLPRIDLPIAYAKCEAYLPTEMSRLKWSGVLQEVARYGDESGGETFGYGHGEAAEKQATTPPAGSIPVLGELFSHPTIAAPPFVAHGGSTVTTTTTFRGAMTGGPPATAERGLITAGGAVGAINLPTIKTAETQGLKQSLASNYYRAGNEFYEKGDFENARKSLENVVKLDPGSVEAGNSTRLLSNTEGLGLSQAFGVYPSGKEGAAATQNRPTDTTKEVDYKGGGGESAGKGNFGYRATTKEQKVAVAQVRGELNEGNRKLLEQQQGFLEKGQALNQQGKKAEAVDQYRAATTLGIELAGRGADVREQESRLRAAKEVIAGADQDREIVTKDQKRRITESEMKSRTTRQPVSGRESSFATKLTDNPVPEAANGGLKTGEVIGVGGGGTIMGGMPATGTGGGSGGGSLFTDARPVAGNWTFGARGAAPAAQPQAAQRSAATVPAAAPAPAEPPPQQVQIGANIAVQRATKGVQLEEFSGGVAGGQLEVADRAARVTTQSFSGAAPQQVTNGGQFGAGPSWKEQYWARSVNVYSGSMDLKGPNAAGVETPAVPPVREYYVQDLVTPTPDFELGRGSLPKLDIKAMPDVVEAMKDYRGNQAARRTSGLTNQGYDPYVPTAQVDSRDAELQDFLIQNYGRLYPAQGQGHELPDGPSLGDFAQKLNWNLGQKVAVNSVNLQVDPESAGALGIAFQAGANGVNYALIDEAQFRTLAELPPAAGPVPFGQSERSQEAIVGTDALLANGWRGNVTYAADRFNRLEVRGNAVEVPHEKYLLINNGGYLTAVRTGAMQFWKEKAAPFQFAAAPQEINVPRVGQIVKFEKTLVKPTDDLGLRVQYQRRSFDQPTIWSLEPLTGGHSLNRPTAWSFESINGRHSLNRPMIWVFESITS